VGFGDAEPHYYGGHSLSGVLQQFMSMKDRDYDGVIVLTDAGSFAFAEDEHAFSIDTPLWLVHFGGLPHAYPDEVADAIAGIDTDLDAVFARMAGGPVDGYAWTFARDARSGLDPAFAPVAARALIGHLGPGVPLDTLHAIAKEHDVVTPWSSMIVLVDDRQREALKEASEAEDRFDREAESGVEATTVPGSDLALSATPEPEEWLLMIMAAVGLLVAVRIRG
jgi:putative PEP-CTERM system integral membrane protein